MDQEGCEVEAAQCYPQIRMCFGGGPAIVFKAYTIKGERGRLQDPAPWQETLFVGKHSHHAWVCWLRRRMLHAAQP